MFDINMSTAILNVIAGYSVGLIIMLFISKKYKNDIAGIFYFAAFYVSCILGTSLSLFRDNLPTLLSVIFSNSLIVFSRLLMLFGIQKFYNTHIRKIYYVFFSILFITTFLSFRVRHPWFQH